MKLHESHYSYLDPDEARFITPEIIRNFCIAGQPDDIVSQLQALEADGLTGIVFSLPADTAFRLTEDFARKVIARM
jgi:alkanesulfonate monooxygenase SsuD/methylene tetrahydromethanopterin reductase-like flavin-dependent oxidoreductase (luciferase family)